MNDYDRGRRDAGIFSEVRYAHGSWHGTLLSTGAEALILEPVNEQYVCGLVAGGCLVEFARRECVAA
jgi:hypothetical protein